MNEKLVSCAFSFVGSTIDDGLIVFQNAFFVCFGARCCVFPLMDSRCQKGSREPEVFSYYYSAVHRLWCGHTTLDSWITSWSQKTRNSHSMHHRNLERSSWNTITTYSFIPDHKIEPFSLLSRVSLLVLPVFCACCCKSIQAQATLELSRKKQKSTSHQQSTILYSCTIALRRLTTAVQYHHTRLIISLLPHWLRTWKRPEAVLYSILSFKHNHLTNNGIQPKHSSDHGGRKAWNTHS